jgi:hypothetical protein
MSNLARVYSITADDYLAGEAVSPIRHEYVAGEVFAMAGATEEHATIALNFAALLRNQVRGGPCRVYIADMKLRVEAADAFFYPDVFVTCDRAGCRGTLGQAPPVPDLRGAVGVHRGLRPGGQIRRLPHPGEPQRIPADRFAPPRRGGLSPPARRLAAGAGGPGRLAGVAQPRLSLRG